MRSSAIAFREEFDAASFHEEQHHSQGDRSVDQGVGEVFTVRRECQCRYCWGLFETQASDFARAFFWIDGKDTCCWLIMRGISVCLKQRFRAIMKPVAWCRCVWSVCAGTLALDWADDSHNCALGSAASSSDEGAPPPLSAPTTWFR